jgi:hypothetical protein
MINTLKKLHVIVGKKPWKVWKGFGSFLLFEFGTKQKDSRGYIHGSNMLWIYMADWRIRCGDDEIAHSESSDSKIEQAAAALIGRRLEAIVFNTVVIPRRVRHGARFFFEGRYKLDVYQYERAKRDAIFMLYTPIAVISYGSDGAIKSKRRSERRGIGKASNKI